MNPLLPLYRIPIPTSHSRDIPKGGDFIIQLVISVQAPATNNYSEVNTMVPDNPAIYKITKSQSYLFLSDASG
jgi:hypothetical protein